MRHDRDGPRYRMLEIIRAYGQERLAEAGESGPIREAHAQYFTQLAEMSQHHLFAAEQLDWLRRLADDQDNLHTAIRGAVSAGDARTAVRLVAALGWYWWLRSMKLEGAELVAEAVAVPGPQDTEQLALAYTMGALLAASTPRDEDAPEWFRMGAELASRIPDPDSPLLRLASPVASLFGAPTLKEPVSPAVFDEAVDDPHPWVRAIAHLLRGHLAVNYGGLHTQAKADFLAAVDIAGTLGDRWVTAVALSAVATLEGWRGEHAAAAEHCRQASQLAAELGTIEDELQFRLFGVRELWLLGEHDRARAELLLAQRDAERLGVPEVLALAAFTAGDLARLDGQHEAARTALVRAAELAAPRHVPAQLRAVTATGLGYLSAADGDLEAARRWHAQALAAARSSADAPVIAQSLVGLADLALHEGRPERAAELLGASSGIRGTTDRSVQDEQMVAEAARAELGEAGYGEAYQRGQRVTLDTLPALIEVTPGA